MDQEKWQFLLTVLYIFYEIFRKKHFSNLFFKSFDWPSNNNTYFCYCLKYCFQKLMWTYMIKASISWFISCLVFKWTFVEKSNVVLYPYLKKYVWIQFFFCIVPLYILYYGINHPTTWHETSWIIVTIWFSFKWRFSWWRHKVI